MNYIIYNKTMLRQPTFDEFNPSCIYLFNNRGKCVKYVQS